MSTAKFAPVVVERAFSTDQIRSMRAALETTMTLMDKSQRRANSIGFEALVRMNQPDPVKAATTAFLQSGAHDFAMQQFPDGYCFLLRNCSFRYHDPASTKSHLNLHFDANFLGLGGKAVNVWVPLDDLGDGVPGLTFLGPEADPTMLYQVWRANRDALLARRDGGPTVVDIFFDNADVRKVYQDLGDAAFVSPRIKAGGLIGFHQFVAHGTEIVSENPKPRGSIEFRIASPDALPDAYRSRNVSLAIVETDSAGRRDVRVALTGELNGIRESEPNQTA